MGFKANRRDNLMLGPGISLVQVTAVRAQNGTRIKALCVAGTRDQLGRGVGLSLGQVIAQLEVRVGIQNGTRAELSLWLVPSQFHF